MPSRLGYNGIARKNLVWRWVTPKQHPPSQEKVKKMKNELTALTCPMTNHKTFRKSILPNHNKKSTTTKIMKLTLHIPLLAVSFEIAYAKNVVQDNGGRLHALQEDRFSIPGDLSVAGINDAIGSSMMSVDYSLSTFLDGMMAWSRPGPPRRTSLSRPARPAPSRQTRLPQTQASCLYTSTVS